jgi:YebC/PmpR family DNA-binding regulatory protein
MSGHSHWATIKRAKGAADAKKGKIFSKLGKEITIVVKAKGGNPDNNPTLRTLIAKAKAAQMPNDNIDRAIKKGTGELESATLVDAVYEGIKGGIAIVCTVLTDNKNRAAAEVSNVFKKNGTELAKQGSAARLFDRMGQVMIPAADGVTEDKVMEVALDAGAEDVIAEDGGFTVKCQCADYTAVVEAIKGAGIAIDEENSAERTLIPNMTAPVSDVAVAKAINKFTDMLEDLEDVQDVYTNMETTDEVDAALEAEG